jgi:superfamily II DNA or RNA helicase
MKQTNYSYQSKAANTVISHMTSPNYVAAVLAACPGAGKTTISQMVLNKYLSVRKQHRVLVLTEGQNTLKNQYIQELDNAHIAINFTYGGFDSDAQVRIGLPQSIDQLKWDGIELLVIDEAHNFYFADMVQNIIKKLNPTHIMLMTGSPTKFNDHNKTQKTQYGIHYISAEDLQQMGVFSSVNMDVIRVVDKKNVQNVVSRAINFATAKGDNLQKIMVACPSIEFATLASVELQKFGYTVALSTSQNDQDDQEIANFKAGRANALIVVGKGILGFNDPSITALFDFKSSSNLDASYQLFARVLRKHPRSVVKSYYRIADQDFNKQVLTLHKMLGLMKTDIFKGFTGKNLKLAIG